MKVKCTNTELTKLCYMGNTLQQMTCRNEIHVNLY